MEKYKEIERSIIKKYRKDIWSKFVKAVQDYELIKENDNIMVCISGGKDSFLLAKCMQELQRHGKFHFDCHYVVMDPGYNDYNRDFILDNAKTLNVPIEMFQSDIFDVVATIDSKSPCYLCARMRRGYLYSKAKELGCYNTHFENVHGLDSENHYSTAYDMSIMAKELIKHQRILNYSKIYEEYFTKSDGTKIWMVNTNKLVRFNKYVDGLKTGYTKNAGYCLTATAKKNKMRLISVVMNEKDSKERTQDTEALLSYGFNGYKIQKIVSNKKILGKITVKRGKEKNVNIVSKENVSKLVKKIDKNKNYKLKIITNKVVAPVKTGDTVGSLKIYNENGSLYKTVDLTVDKNIKRSTYFDILKNTFKQIIGG